MGFFLLLNTKEDILKNVGSLTRWFLGPIDFHGIFYFFFILWKSMRTQLFVYTHTHDSSTISMFYVNVLGNGDTNFGRNQTQSGASSPLANEGTVCDSGSIKTNWIETLRNICPFPSVWKFIHSFHYTGY